VGREYEELGVEDGSEGEEEVSLGAAVSTGGCSARGESGSGSSSPEAEEESEGRLLRLRRLRRGLSGEGSTKLSSSGAAGCCGEVEETGWSGMTVEE
jgi:hypothetical protein